MTLSKSLAQILLRLSAGERIAGSKLKNLLIKELLDEGIIFESRSGRTKSTLTIPNSELLRAFLLNRYSISDLRFYVDTLRKEDVTRADLVEAGSNSKIKKIRTFTGFLVNSFQPICATLNNASISIYPAQGTFLFVHDPSNFKPAEDITIVGVENPENFRYIARQRHLFSGIDPLFVCRYPQGQSKDFINWLRSVSNSYLHFGDFDFAGIGIYLNEYKRHLGSRSMFFVPPEIESLIRKWGNVNLYNRQKFTHDLVSIDEPQLESLVEIIHKFKKGLEQEILINKHTND